MTQRSREIRKYYEKLVKLYCSLGNCDPVPLNTGHLANNHPANQSPVLLQHGHSHEFVSCPAQSALYRFPVPGNPPCLDCLSADLPNTTKIRSPADTWSVHDSISHRTLAWTETWVCVSVSLLPLLYLPANENTHSNLFNSDKHSVCVCLSLQYRVFIPHHSAIFFFYQAVNSRETVLDEEQGQRQATFIFICQSIVSQMAVMPVPILSLV